MRRNLLITLLTIIVILLLHHIWNDANITSLQKNTIEKDKVSILSINIINAIYSNNEEFIESLLGYPKAKSKLYNTMNNVNFLDALHIEVINISVPRRNNFEVIVTCTIDTGYTQGFALSYKKNKDKWMLIDFKPN